MKTETESKNEKEKEKGKQVCMVSLVEIAWN